MNTATQYQPLFDQAIKALDSYALTLLGQYNGQRVYTNREGLYIGSTPNNARKASPSDLELSLNEVN